MSVGGGGEGEIFEMFVSRDKQGFRSMVFGVVQIVG